MASYTKNLNLLKKDPVADGADTFNIETMLNENWDKIDEKVATGKAMNDHITNQKNPHKVTAEQVGAASSVHSHTIDQVEGLTTALSNKADLVDGEVPLSQLPQLHQDIGVYVDAVNGSDDNSGSPQAPFKTIQTAVDSLPRNLGTYAATIYVAPGEYQAGATIQGFYGGGKRYANAITIQANGEEIPVINGNFLISGVSCSLNISNLKIIGRIESDSSSQVSIIGVSVDPSTADIGVGVRTLFVSNLFLQAVTVDNASVAAVSVSQGTAYIRDLRGSGNACAVSSGDTLSGGPALVLTTQISAEATTKYVTLYGGTIIENGVIV